MFPFIFPLSFLLVLSLLLFLCDCLLRAPLSSFCSHARLQVKTGRGIDVLLPASVARGGGGSGALPSLRGVGNGGGVSEDDDDEDNHGLASSETSFAAARGGGVGSSGASPDAILSGAVTFEETIRKMKAEMEQAKQVRVCVRRSFSCLSLLLPLRFCSRFA